MNVQPISPTPTIVLRDQLASICKTYFDAKSTDAPSSTLQPNTFQPNGGQHVCEQVRPKTDKPVPARPAVPLGSPFDKLDLSKVPPARLDALLERYAEFCLSTGKFFGATPGPATDRINTALAALKSGRNTNKVGYNARKNYNGFTWLAAPLQMLAASISGSTILFPPNGSSPSTAAVPTASFGAACIALSALPTGTDGLPYNRYSQVIRHHRFYGHAYIQPQTYSIATVGFAAGTANVSTRPTFRHMVFVDHFCLLNSTSIYQTEATAAASWGESSSSPDVLLTVNTAVAPLNTTCGVHLRSMLSTVSFPARFEILHDKIFSGPEAAAGDVGSGSGVVAGSSICAPAGAFMYNWDVDLRGIECSYADTTASGAYPVDNCIYHLIYQCDDIAIGGNNYAATNLAYADISCRSEWQDLGQVAQNS